MCQAKAITIATVKTKTLAELIGCSFSFHSTRILTLLIIVLYISTLDNLPPYYNIHLPTLYSSLFPIFLIIGYHFNMLYFCFICLKQP